MKTQEDMKEEAAPTTPMPGGPLPTILDPADASLRMWAPFNGSSQVQYRALWTDPRTGSYSGLLRLDAGASIAVHRHRSAVHHIWVSEGCCTMGGRHLEKGSYVFVPATAEHGIDWAGPEGCTLFYLYLRTPID